MLRKLKYLLILFFTLISFQVKAQFLDYFYHKESCKNVKIGKDTSFIIVKNDTINLPVFKVEECLMHYSDSIIFIAYIEDRYYPYYDKLMIIYTKPKISYKEIPGFVNFDPYVGNIAYFPFPSQYVKIYNVFLRKDIDSIKITYKKMPVKEYMSYFGTTAIKKDTIVFFLDRFHYPKTPLLPEFVNKTYTAVKIHYSPADKRRLKKILGWKE